MNEEKGLEGETLMGKDEDIKKRQLSERNNSKSFDFIGKDEESKGENI